MISKRRNRLSNFEELFRRWRKFHEDCWRANETGGSQKERGRESTADAGESPIQVHRWLVLSHVRHMAWHCHGAEWHPFPVVFLGLPFQGVEVVDNKLQQWLSDFWEAAHNAGRLSDPTKRRGALCVDELQPSHGAPEFYLDWAIASFAWNSRIRTF